MSWSSSVVAVGVAAVLIAVVALFMNRDALTRLSSGETTTETIVVDETTGSVVRAEDVSAEPTANSATGTHTTREVMVTGGERHSVPLHEIRGGGPAKDGIPSIDDPQFVSIAEADFITDEEPGIAVSLNGMHRFYPFQILVWHEIVNDSFGSDQVLITYCPLCLSGVVFDPLVQGERVEFGTSGKLWQSNLVMYDRKTDSYWSQILGEAIKGEMTGSKLKVLPSDQMRFGEWRELHPRGQVLSQKTGAFRVYGSDPYGDYYTDNSAVYFPVAGSDDRLAAKDFVLGVEINGQAKAYYPPAIKEQGVVRDTFAGVTVEARYDSQRDVVQLFSRVGSGEFERLNPTPSFWFAWVAAHPDTELLK